MTIIYENGYYHVVSNPFENKYYVVNSKRNQVESIEDAEPTAKYKADALKAVTMKWNENKSVEDSNK